MKTHHLIMLTTAVATALFYRESFGLNVGLLAIFLSVITIVKTHKKRKDREFFILFVLSILSAFAFMWYGDFVSFLAVSFSLLLLRFKSKYRRLKSILAVPIMTTNNIAFPYRFFDFNTWIIRDKNSKFNFKSIIILVIPILFFLFFFWIYSMGSSIFSEVYLYELDIDSWFFVVAGLAFYFSFGYWNFSGAKFFLRQNQFLQNEFSERVKNQKFKPFLEFLDLDSERKIGVLTFVLLNLLLLVFILVFNYEQFFQVDTDRLANLSADTHSRVNVVILSIVMAVLLLMLYFRSYFNFDDKSLLLKKLAKMWIVLNSLLVLSALIKNTEYIYHWGLTYKRLGVYAFLILSVIGLIFTYLKIEHRKTNFYLFNQMIWYFYGTLLLCSFVNWGYIGTFYNIKVQKVSDFDAVYEFDFNDSLLLEYYPDEIYFTYRFDYVKSQKKDERFLSKVLYYQFINLPDEKPASSIELPNEKQK